MEKFLDSLPDDDRGTVKAKLHYLEEKGNELREPLSKSRHTPRLHEEGPEDPSKRVRFGEKENAGGLR